MNNGHFFVNLNDRAILGKSFEFEINDSFFYEMGGEITKGHIKANVRCEVATAQIFLFSVHSVGSVFTPCDRCLDEVELRIDINNRLDVRIGDEDDDEGDTLIVGRNRPVFDLAYLVYQFVALSLPISRVHQPGRCNQAMMDILNDHQVARSDQEADDKPDNRTSDDIDTERGSDHRWDKLKQLLNK